MTNLGNSNSAKRVLRVEDQLPRQLLIIAEGTVEDSMQGLAVYCENT